MCIWIFFENETSSSKKTKQHHLQRLHSIALSVLRNWKKTTIKTAIAKVSSTFGRSFSWAVAAIKKWTLVPWWIQLSFLKLCRLAFVKPHRTLSPNSEQQTPSCKLLSSKAEKQNPSYTIRAATSEHMWIQDTDFLYPHHTCVYIVVFINIYTIWYLFNTTIISMGLIYARYFKRYNKYCSIS